MAAVHLMAVDKQQAEIQAAPEMVSQVMRPAAVAQVAVIHLVTDQVAAAVVIAAKPTQVAQ